jgi:hypothetical protein
MTKPPAHSLSVLADLRPADDTAASIRAAIARALGKRAAAHAHRGELAASIPHLTLETDDEAHLDQVEADVRSADRDLARIDALLLELRTRLVPAQHEEAAQRLAVQAQHTNETCDACRAWTAETMPAIVEQILRGARLRLNAKLVHQSYMQALHTSGLPVELAATLPTVTPPMSAMAHDTTTLSGEQKVAAMLLSALHDAERIVAFR